jgi:pSer/pThr/pTyr-binding forkhead associated (FHA) protein
MAAIVRVTVTEGVPQKKEFVFDNRTLCTVGRSADCLLQVPNDLAHLDVSRRHCVLDINPPEVRVRDLGSRNGTYVNGHMIGRRAPCVPPEDANALDLPETLVYQGDEIRLGSTVLRVEIDAGAEEAVGAGEAANDHCVLVG